MSSSAASFKNKVILITGAAGQFGSAGVRYFLKAGCRGVVACDLSSDAVAAALEDSDAVGSDEVPFRVPLVPSDLASAESSAIAAVESGSRVLAISCNVTDAAAVGRAVFFAAGVYGGIDLCWNNAGYQGAIVPTLSYPPEDFARVMDVNVTGMFNVMQAVAKTMASRPKEKSGPLHPYAIVNTASVAALRCTPAMIAYASSKAAVLAMTVCAAKDLAQQGIRVNAVSPALIGPGGMWDRQNELHAASGSPYFDEDPEKVAANKIAGVPMKRLGSVDEVISAVAFLLGEGSSYVTGTNLVVDGGMSGGIKA